MALNQALGITPPPTRQAALPVPDAGAGYETQATAKRKELEPLQQRISEAQTEATKLAGEKATFETQQKAKQASGESQAMQSFEQRVAAAPMRPMLEQKTAQEKDFFFRPSQEDGLMMAGLASLITVLGTAVGKGGKGYAQAALSGMNGMMQGYRQGRDDVFRQEKMAFETNARALRDQISSIRQALQDYEKEAARDRDGALLRMREKLAQEGADFAAARVERQGVVSMLPELIRQERALNDQIGRYEMKATDARTRADAAEAARVARVGGGGKGMIMKDEKGDFYSVTPQGVVPIPKPSGIGPLMPAGGKGVIAGQNALTFASRVYGNIENAANDLVNIAKSPGTATSPVLAGITGAEPATVLKSLVALASRQITPQENRIFQQLSDQLGAALSRLEAQGLASGGTKANIAAFNAMRPGAGDSGINMAIYLARVKQEIQTGVRVLEEMPGATAGQKKKAKEALDKIERAIPFDVDKALEVAANNRATLSNRMVRLLNMPSIAEQLEYQGMKVYDNDKARKTQPESQEGQAQAPAAATSVEAERANAQAAIAAGAPKETVRQRFKQKTGQDL